MKCLRLAENTCGCVRMCFLPYMGSKRRLLPQLLDAVPREFNTYIEPFLGSGALLYALRPQTAVACDHIPALVKLHVAVKEECEAVIQEYKSLTVTKRVSFFDIRGRYPDVSPAEFFFLLRNCHGNRYRVNRAGKFNTPYKENSLQTVSAKALENTSQKLRQAFTALSGCSVTFLCSDAIPVVARAKPGDFIFLDPPYQWEPHQENDYGRAFGKAGWARLMEALAALPAGVHIMVTLHGAMPREEVLALASEVIGLHHLTSLSFAGTHLQRGGNDTQRDWLLTNYKVSD